MDEREFVAKAEAELARLDDALTDLEREDLDWQLGDGVLTIELHDRSKIIVSTNRPARELWVALRAQGLHFGFDAATSSWRTTGGQELYDAISAQLSERLGETIRL